MADKRTPAAGPAGAPGPLDGLLHDTARRAADPAALAWLERLLRDGERAAGGAAPGTPAGHAPPAPSAPRRRGGDPWLT